MISTHAFNQVHEKCFISQKVQRKILVLVLLGNYGQGAKRKLGALRSLCLSYSHPCTLLYCLYNITVRFKIHNHLLPHKEIVLPSYMKKTPKIIHQMILTRIQLESYLHVSLLITVSNGIKQIGILKKRFTCQDESKTKRYCTFWSEP